MEDNGKGPRLRLLADRRRQPGNAVVNLGQQGADEVQPHRLLSPADREERRPGDIGNPLIQRLGEHEAGRLAAREAQQEEHPSHRPGPGGMSGQASLQGLKEDIPLLTVGDTQVRNLRREMAGRDVAVNHALGKGIGVQVRHLLQKGEAGDDLGRTGDPGDPKAGGNSLAEGPHR